MPMCWQVSALEEHDEPGKDDVGEQQDDDKKKNPAPYCTHSQNSFSDFYQMKAAVENIFRRREGCTPNQ